MNDERVKADNIRDQDINTSNVKEVKTIFRPALPNFNVTDDDSEEPKGIKFGFKVQFIKPNCQGVNCPVFDQNMELKPHVDPIKVDFLSGCKIKDKCQCRLDFQSTSTKTQIVVGKDKDLKLSYDISNKNGNEPGYGVRLVLKSNIQLKTPYSSTGLRNCHPKGNDHKELECDLKKIKKKQTSKIELRLRLPEDNFKDQNTFEITPTFHSNCNGERKTDPLSQTRLKLEFKSDLRIKYQKEQEEQSYRRDIKTELVQPIEVTNLGPSFTNKATKATVFVPKFDFLESKVQLENLDCNKARFQETSGFKSEPEIKNYYCESKETCIVFECTIAKHWKKDETKVINVELSIGIFLYLIVLCYTFFVRYVLYISIH